MIFVQFEQTQNPDVVRIFPERLDMAEAGDDTDENGIAVPNRYRASLVGALLAIAGIAKVAVEQDVITVTRADASYSWVALWPQIDRVIFGLLNGGWLGALLHSAPLPSHF